MGVMSLWIAQKLYQTEHTSLDFIQKHTYFLFLHHSIYKTRIYFSVYTYSFMCYSNMTLSVVAFQQGHRRQWLYRKTVVTKGNQHQSALCVDPKVGQEIVSECGRRQSDKFCCYMEC